MGINSFENNHFALGLIRKPVPFLIRVKMEHHIFGEIVRVNYICWNQIIVV